MSLPFANLRRRAHPQNPLGCCSIASDSAGTALVLSTRPALLVSSSCSSIASNWSFVFISEQAQLVGLVILFISPEFVVGL